MKIHILGICGTFMGSIAAIPLSYWLARIGNDDPLDCYYFYL